MSTPSQIPITPQPTQLAPRAPKPQLVPARYVGDIQLQLERAKPLLNADGSPVLDERGQPKLAVILAPGDIIPMPETEVHGMTFWHDPQFNQPSQFIGAGHVVKAEHGDYSRVELGLIGYEFHGGRLDFQPADAPWPLPDASAPVATVDEVPAAAPAVAIVPAPPLNPAPPPVVAPDGAAPGNAATTPNPAQDSGKPSRKAALPPTSAPAPEPVQAPAPATTELSIGDSATAKEA